MKVVISIIFTLFVLSQLEQVHCNGIFERIKAEIALRNLYLDFVMNFQKDYDDQEPDVFAKRLNEYAFKRIENEKLNNFWRLRQG